MKFARISSARIAGAVIASAGLILVGVVAANGAVKPDCKNLMYPLCARSVAAMQVVDNSIPKSKIVPADRDAFLKDEVGVDVKGGIVAADSFDAVVIEKVGGSFKTNKTKLGSVNIKSAGKYRIDISMFAIRNTAGAAGTRPQLAARVGSTDTAFGLDFGTVFPGPLSPTKDREITGSTFKIVTVDGPTTVDLFGFGYNDDQSAAGSGEFSMASSISVTAI